MRLLILAGLLLCIACACTPAGLPKSENEACTVWFGKGAAARPLSVAASSAIVQEVTQNGAVAGWVFRTDQVDPQVKGKRGEIALLAGLDRQGKIIGVLLLDHKEDAKYFGRITPRFFAQFAGHAVVRGTEGLDTVTGATVSSRAMLQDVTRGAASVLALPEVAANLAR